MKLSHSAPLFALLTAILASTACAELASVLPTPTVAPLTVDALKNAEYQSEFALGGKAKLTNGTYKEKLVPGSPAYEDLVISLSDKYAFGDLNGDGVGDAAAILMSNSGGSGTFFRLAAVLNENGTPTNVASTILGDRVQIKSVSIQSGRLIVNVIKQGPNDPLCCPTMEVVETYALQGDKLVKISG